MGDNGDHTPGPWGWFGNASVKKIYLATTHSGRQMVMTFDRWGMKDAQPVFWPKSRRAQARDLCTFEVGDRGVVGHAAAKAHESVYRYDIAGIDSADARLIAASPDLFAVAKAYEAWEADVVFDGNWEDGLPKLTQPLFDRLLEIQAMRNAALAKVKGDV